jgi:tetratricopeptide (TPR) repeat protein
MTLPSRSADPRRMPTTARVLRVLALLPLVLAAACGREDEAPPEGADRTAAADADEVQRVVARERAAALYAEDSFSAAYEALAPLLERDPVDPEDLVRAAILDLQNPSTVGVDEREARALERLAEALRRRPDDAAAHFVLGSHYSDRGQWEEALPHVQRALELAPRDYPLRLLYARILDDRASWAETEEERAALDAEQDRVLSALIDEGFEYLGSWMVTALYRRHSLRSRTDHPEAQQDYDRYQALRQAGVAAPSNTELSRGVLGRVHFPPPSGTAAQPVAELPLQAEAPATWPAGLRTLRALTLLERWHGISARDLDPDLEYVGTRRAELVQVDAFVSPPSLVGDDGRSLWRIHRGEDGSYTPRELFRAPGDQSIEAWTALDLGEDRALREEFAGESRGTPYLRQDRPQARNGVNPSDLEFVVAVEGALYLFEEQPEGWRPRPEPIARCGGTVHGLLAADVDHDGDLDLLAVGEFGGLLLRNDGAEHYGPRVPSESTPGGFTPATEQLGLPAGRAFRYVLAEDFDSDQDLDLLFGGPSGAHLCSSLRNERWGDGSAALPQDLQATRAPLAADFDADGLADLWWPADGRLLRNVGGTSFVALGEATELPPADALPLALDVDLDGAWDVVWNDDQGRLGGVLALGRPERRVCTSPAIGRGPLALAELDGDGRLEVAVAGASQLAELHGPAGILLALEGVKDNTRGVGAVVEVRAGPVYRQIYWSGEPVLIGTGGRPAESLRVTWPNGVFQNQADTAAGERRVLEQVEGLVGSCPFLYVWDGETFVFVSDVLGITPLGLPMAPGQLVPPDHDEYVLVRGEQLRAQEDGLLELQLTEELREVTYLDQVRLIAIDHPEGSEVFPTERFSFPPFPAPHTHTVRDPAPVLRALDGEGRDWAAALAAEDGELAEPFAPHRGQFLGLADPYTLELHFDPAAVAGAQRLRLLLCGWLYWTDASVNVAAARHPGYEFLPPLLQVPDGQGGWRDTGPPVGFPAGKTKTMVLEVDGLLDPADPRLRLVSTLRLYWDAIRLATCGDDEPRVETTLELADALLWERGFSETVWLDGDARLEWFDWDRLAPEPRWNQHPGRYTRHGTVTPLLTAVDDQFAILGAGDALRLRFDGTALPELPSGWRRDYLVYFDGWAKDRDPNTYGALFVEPLPFHGMSGYPYGADESYPDTPEHRAYRREWNTREAKVWLPPLRPLDRGRARPQ